MITEDYEIRQADKSEAPGIVSFLREHHSSEDVISRGFLTKNRDRINEAEKKLMDETWKKFVSEYPSLVAIHKNTSEIAGVIIHVPITNANLYNEEQLPGQLQILRELDAIVCDIYAEVGMAERFPRAKKTLKLRSLAVHRSHRGKGLAKALIRESLEWAKRHGFDLVHSFFTSPAAKQAALGSGLAKVAEYDLHTVKKEDGSCAFSDLSPDNITWIMALAIEA